MTLKKKIVHNDEIDLIEVFIIILKNKTKIFLTTFLSLILMIVYIKIDKPVKLEYEIISEITPISTYDEFEYQSYNDYLSNTTSIILQYPIKMKNETFIVNEVSMDVDEASFEKIDQKYLMNLFIQKILEPEYIFKIIIESGTINKEDYNNELDYKNYLDSFYNSIQITEIKDSKIISSNQSQAAWSISFWSDNLEKSKNFLKFLEINTNLEVKNYIKKNFQTLINTQKNIKKYKAEDIELELKNTSDEMYKRRLELEKMKLLMQKDIERVQQAFETTPIMKSIKFNAARINYDKIKYVASNDKNFSIRSKIIISILFGLILGILYALISTSIKKRKKI